MVCILYEMYMKYDLYQGMKVSKSEVIILNKMSHHEASKDIGKVEVFEK